MAEAINLKEILQWSNSYFG